MKIFLSILLLIHTACHPFKSFDTADSINKRVKLIHKFEIIVGKKDVDVNAYSLFILKHHNKTVFIDSTSDYEFEDKLYPIVNEINKNTFELLFEVNDRPNKNVLKYLKIRNNKVVEIKSMPTFFGRATNIDNDSKLEFAGIWDYVQVWTLDNDTTILTDYNPIIYYEITSEGIILDSTLTINRNKYLYGQFFGYKIDESKTFTARELEPKINFEIDKIEQKQNKAK